jgi:iron(III) transport system permease protein
MTDAAQSGPRRSRRPTRYGTGDLPLRARLGSWRRWLAGEGHPGWGTAAAAVGLLVTVPVIAIIVLALTSPGGSFRHLAVHVLPAAVYETGLLLSGVGCLTAIVGMLTAWLVTMYRFPGVHVVDRLLVLPLAMPAYIIAYCYVDLLDYSGPVQSGLRALFGWKTPRDYWFPDVRSIPGAVVLFSAVLYPYVYMIARASFVQQSACALEVARTLGRSPWSVFREVALPLARPALAAGVALALMECLNDLGAVQHLGLRTLSAAIFTTWLQRSDLAGAVQLALVLLLVATGLIAVERWSRGRGRRTASTERHRAVPFETLHGWPGIAALLFCLLPVVVGFAIPVAVLVRHAIAAGSEGVGGGYVTAALNSTLLAGVVMVTTVCAASVVLFARRAAPSPLTHGIGTIAGIGYALPGTVLAIGLLFPLAGIDRWLAALLGTGALLSGTIAAITMACTIRFLAVAIGAIEDGLGRISPNLDAAARTLGATPAEALARIHVPILSPAIAAAGLLVFVDAMKELPATLLLRPFNFETLATSVYNKAALEQFELAAASCLTIVLVGLIPVLLLHRAVATGRAGRGG